jgi:integrase
MRPVASTTDLVVIVTSATKRSNNPSDRGSIFVTIPLRICAPFHNLRHGLSTFLIENGHDPVVVQRMLRQSRVDMTMHYVHNSRKARNAQAQYIEHSLSNGSALGDRKEGNSEKRERMREQ